MANANVNIPYLDCEKDNLSGSRNSECPICNFPLASASETINHTPCGWSYCRYDFDAWAASCRDQNRTPNCPHCRALVTNEEFASSFDSGEDEVEDDREPCGCIYYIDVNGFHCLDRDCTCPCHLTGLEGAGDERFDGFPSDEWGESEESDESEGLEESEGSEGSEDSVDADDVEVVTHTITIDATIITIEDDSSDVRPPAAQPESPAPADQRSAPDAGSSTDFTFQFPPPWAEGDDS